LIRNTRRFRPPIFTVAVCRSLTPGGLGEQIEGVVALPAEDTVPPLAVVGIAGQQDSPALDEQREQDGEEAVGRALARDHGALGRADLEQRVPTLIAKIVRVVGRTRPRWGLRRRARGRSPGRGGR
jgi:hypothetical protein